MFLLLACRTEIGQLRFRSVYLNIYEQLRTYLGKKGEFGGFYDALTNDKEQMIDFLMPNMYTWFELSLDAKEHKGRIVRFIHDGG